ncbi:TM1812 family CRISPR-associated protein [Acinetobacter baumannii]|uniref:TM1812 family CRISPR-associated protein n=1 Tax=Acinetobacter baumannii TaxID=470 RepID=UPI0007F90081|nr:TM1812 family CRISPR-associated protein [Acinetobacter baumannii]EHU2507829.1 hypothetical protein [Acinetobacter baumannii]OBM16044.1 hypothetical protein A9933_10625 [Acinetobacter baumannii]
MLFSPDDLKKLTILNTYASLVDEAYTVLEQYYCDEAKERTYNQQVKLLFEEFKNQIFYIENAILYINVDKEFLQTFITEYVVMLNRVVTGDNTPHQLLVGVINNIYLFLSNFTVEESPSPLNLHSSILVRKEEFSRLISLLKGILSELNKIGSDELKVIQDKLFSLEDRVFLLNAKLRFSDDKIEKAIESFLKKKKDEFVKEAEGLIDNLKGDISNYNYVLQNDLSIEIDKLKNDINTKVDVLNELGISLHSYQNALAVSTEKEFSKFYIKKAKEEKTIYYVMSGVSILIIVLSIVLAWCSLETYYQNYVNPIGLKETLKGLTNIQVEWAQKTAFLYMSLRLVMSILLFLTVIYTSRLAYRSYLHWRHSENTHLKVSTLRPFIGDLPDADKLQIKKDLVPDFFGKEAGNIDCNNESFKDLPTNVSALAAKAIEQVGNNINTKSNTGKNGNKPEDKTE